MKCIIQSKYKKIFISILLLSFLCINFSRAQAVKQKWEYFENLNIAVISDYSLRTGKMIVTISKNNNDYLAEFYDEATTLKSNISPNSGWIYFFSELEKNEFFYLPGESGLEEREDIYTDEDGELMMCAHADGVRYNVKISFKIGAHDYFREFSYSNPKFYKRDDAVKFTTIIDIIKKEFNLIKF